MAGGGEGKPIDKSLIYKLLNNRVYLGEIKHKAQWYKGTHAPIIDQPLWDQVQAILETNWRKRAPMPSAARCRSCSRGWCSAATGGPCRRTIPEPLRSALPLLPAPARRQGARRGVRGLPRLPAADLESAVMEQIRAILRSPQMVEEAARGAVRLDPTLDAAQVTVAHDAGG